jgi:osmotically-inducible protein OsmY
MMNRLLLACMIGAACFTIPAAQAQVKDRYYGDERYIKDDRPVARHYFRAAMGSSRSDAILQDEVQDALFDVLGRRANRIDVDVDDGHARLSGIVPNRRAFALAREIADDVPGIRTVSTRRLYVD